MLDFSNRAALVCTQHIYHRKADIPFSHIIIYFVCVGRENMMK